jgi:hypothetical protein
MFATPTFPYCTCNKKTKIIFGICLILFLVTKGGYAMQPPPPPLNIAQLKLLISEADMIAVGKINEVKETEGAVEASLCIEKLLKGKVAGKMIVIKETYRINNSQLHSPVSKDEDESQKMIVSSIAGPSTYHGTYKKGSRIIVLMEKIEGTDTYRPLGSGTYNKHLCEFLIEDDGIKTYYFKFAEDVGKYIAGEKQFIGFIKKLIKSSSNKGGE